jgi:RNA polymerase sigma factor (sigma-70 family)
VASSSQAIVSNEAYEAAWANAHNRRIIAAVSRLYKGKMPPEEILFCVQMALFKCMKKHKDSVGNKFTTSLHQFAEWELQKGLRAYCRETARHPPMSSIDDHHNLAAHDLMFSFEVRECLDQLSVYDQKLIEQKFLYDMTLREIERENNSNRQTVNRKLTKATEKFKYLWSKQDG